MSSRLPPRGLSRMATPTPQSSSAWCCSSSISSLAPGSVASATRIVRFLIGRKGQLRIPECRVAPSTEIIGVLSLDEIHHNSDRKRAYSKSRPFSTSRSEPLVYLLFRAAAPTLSTMQPANSGDSTARTMQPASSGACRSSCTTQPARSGAALVLQPAIRGPELTICAAFSTAASGAMFFDVVFFIFNFLPDDE